MILIKVENDVVPGCLGIGTRRDRKWTTVDCAAALAITA